MNKVNSKTHQIVLRIRLFNKTPIQNYGTDYKNINRNYWQFMN